MLKRDAQVAIKTYRKHLRTKKTIGAVGKLKASSASAS